MQLEELLAAGDETEAERVERWRYETLARVGYPSVAALALAARADVNLHQACELVTVHGCDPVVAARILL